MFSSDSNVLMPLDRIRILILILLVIFSIPTIAQDLNNPTFSSIDNTSGLPSNSVNAIAQDDNGFLWFGTNEGLCRYDSPNNISVFEKGALGLKSSNIRSLYYDDNILWIGTRFGGLVKLNLDDYSHKSYVNDSTDVSSLSNDEILCIAKINDKLIFAGTEYGLNILDPDSDKNYAFTLNHKPNGLETKSILSIYQDRQGLIWIGTWGGGLYHCHLDKSGDLAKTRFVKVPFSSFSGSQNVWQIYQDTKDRIWLGTCGGGLFITDYNYTDNNHWDFIKFPFITKVANYLSSEFINDIKEDKDGNIWIGAIHGLYLIEKSKIDNIGNKLTQEAIHSLQLNHITNTPDKIGTINNNNIKKLFQCRQDLIWIGSIGGVNKYNSTESQFEIHKLPSKESRQVDLINGIFPISENELLIGAEISGLGTFNTENNTFEKLNLCNINHQESRLISSMYDDGNMHYYVGTSNGLVKIHKENKSCTYLPFPKSILQKERNFFISVIFKDSKKRLWLGTEKGLFLVDEEKNTFRFNANDPTDKYSLTDSFITRIFEDSNNDIWITTYNGISKLIDKKGDPTFTNFKKEAGSHLDNILSNKVTCVQQFKDHLYFSSHNGLFAYNLLQEKFEAIKKEYKQSVIGFEITKKGELWASTVDGITKYDLVSNDIIDYNNNDAVGSISYRINAFHKDKSENIFFGGVNGFTKVVPTKVYKNKNIPPVKITSLKILNSEKDTTINLLPTKNIELNHDTYYLGFDFCALNYNQIDKNKYAYKLEGFRDDDWTYLGAPEHIVYTNLKPGKYTFKVKASNNHGLWNELGDAVEIEIHPAFWQTLWFKIVSAILIILLLASIISWYTNNITERNKILSEYNEKLNVEIDERKKVEKIILEREQKMKDLLNKLEETNTELSRSNKDLEQFAYVASHDIKEPLRTIGTFVDLFNKNFNQQINAQGKEYLGFITDGVYRMSNLINSLLTYSRVGTITTSFREADLNNILEEKLKDLKPLIEEKNVTIKYNKLPTIICASDQISMVLYNLILNGIKFNKSEEKIIDVSVVNTEKKYVICVKDNGIGISKKYQSQIFEIFKRLHTKEEYEGTGIGLALCKKIIDRHHGKIWLESNPDEGSAFYFSISKYLKKSKVLEQKAG